MVNYTIIGGDGKEYGELTEADIQQWISEGRLNGQSQAKGEGDQGFRPLSLFPEFANALSGNAATPGIIAPSSGSAGTDDTDWQEEVLSRAPKLKLGECLAAGWSFLGGNTGFVIGAVLLAWLASLLMLFVSLVVPLIGPMAYDCFYGVIMGGFYLACLRRLRGEAVLPGDVFCGFRVAFAQLLLASIVSIMLTGIGFCCCVLPWIYLLVAWAFVFPLTADKRLFFWSAMEISRKVVTRVWFEVAMLLLITFMPVLLFQAFSSAKSSEYITPLVQACIKMYHQAGGNMLQFLQLVTTKGSFDQGMLDELDQHFFKLYMIGQVVVLVNLFYAAGVITRAYENLFGSKKP